MKTLGRAFLPAMITFGPLFIVIASVGNGSSGSLGLSLAGYAGAVAVAIGLATMLRAIVRQEEEIQQLRRRLTRDS